ncbi:MAG: hypothetical protein ACHQ50_05775 [Fimbriimonadales bacterium]
MLLELGHDRGYLVSSPRGPFRYNRRFATLPWRAPIGVVSPGNYGVLDEFHYWNAVLGLYRQDDLQGAIQVMDRIGIGMYGDYGMAGDIVYIEAATGEVSEIVRINERFEVECIRAQLPFAFDDLGNRLASAYSHVRSIFGDSTPPIDTLLTLLFTWATIPTATWRDGYFTPKTRYGKICLPMPQDLDVIEAGFRRELMFQFAFEASAGEAEPWLLEAATMMDGGSVAGPASKLLFGESLNRTLYQESDSPEAFEMLSEAQDQCHRLGRTMLAFGGAERLVKCLEECARAAQSPGLGTITKRAIKAAYGLSFEDLFERALT